MQLYATELMGAETYDDQGNFVGRVREFFIEPADQPNRIARLLLSRGRFQPLVAKYDQVATVAPGTIRLNCNERALEFYQPNEGWLAVRKDLLDQQIIDTQGRKVVRVNDVDLGGDAHERKCGVAADAGGCWAAGSGATAAAGYCVAVGCAEIAERTAAADDSVGVRELDRARSIAAGEAADHAREAGGSASGGPGGDDGGTVGGGAAGNYRVAR